MAAISFLFTKCNIAIATPFVYSTLPNSTSSSVSFLLLPQTKALNIARANRAPREVFRDIDDAEENPFQIPEASPLQSAASILLTGSIAILLFRSLRRRSQRAKELRLRSTGVERLQEKAPKPALSDATKPQEANVSRPNAGQTFLGAVVAGAIAAVFYKFTITVEGSFADKAVSANYSVRQITITIRTIVNGLLYLATFVFAANSIGLFLYSLQLALNFPLPPSNSDSKPVNITGDVKSSTKAADAENDNSDEA